MAAPLGFKTFNTGDVLTAADTNGYLMQGVWTFANAAARTAAVTSPQEGNVSYLKDTDSLEIYSGSAWVAYGSGDITGVTAGTGITGGGTSGTVTITNDMATKIDAKGDLIIGTGADTYDRLAVGTNNYVLTADSTQTTGMKWAAAAAGGKVLQVVQATYSTGASTTSTSYVDVGLSASITPSANTSKVLVIYSVLFDNISGYGAIQLVRGTTAIQTPWGYQFRGSGIANYSYLDSPATTSSTTYKLQYKSGSGTFNVQSDSQMSTILLLEIGA